MRRKIFVVALALLMSPVVPAAAHGRDLGREVLGPADGWGAGTTGGANAAQEDVSVVENRAELAAALARHPGAPKIVYVRGRIEGNVDAANRPMSCSSFADPGYSLPAYLAQYDPATWGKQPVTGPLEEARARSQRNQEDKVVLPVGSDTTVVGLGDNATLHGLTLRIHGSDKRHPAEPAFRGRARLLPAVGPERRRAGQLELRVRQRRADRGHPRLGRPQRLQRRRQHEPADLLRDEVRGARRAAGHGERL